MQPSYSQRDPQWAGILLGFNTSNEFTIGTAGCYITSIANVCFWAGRAINPQQVNDACKQYNAFIDGGILNRDDVPARLCLNLHFTGRTDWNGPTPMQHFSDADDPNVAYILRIDASPAQGVQQHYVMVWARAGGSDLQIIDSWDGQKKLLSHYGTPSAIIYSAIRIAKDEAQAPAPEPTPAPAPVVTDPPAASSPPEASPSSTPVEVIPPPPTPEPQAPSLTEPAAPVPVVSIHSKLPPLVGALLRFLARLFFPGAR